MPQKSLYVKIELIVCLLFATKSTVDSYPRERIGRLKPPRPCDTLRGSTEGADGKLRRPPACNGADLPKPPPVKHTYAYCISDGKTIPRGCICDGKFDCEDLSDEYLCTMANQVVTEDTRDFVRSLLRRVNDSQPYFLSRSIMRQRETPDRVFHSRKRTTSESAFDLLGRVCTPGFHDRATTHSHQVFPCDVCEPGQILCSQLRSNYSMKCVDKSEICDGISHCPNDEDELHCGMEKRRKTNSRSLANIVARRNRNQSQIITTCESLRKTMNSVIDGVKAMRKLEGMIKRMHPFAEHEEIRRSPMLSSITHSLISSISIQRLQYTSSNNSLLTDQICDHKFDCDGGIDEMLCPRRFYCQSGNPLFVNSSAISDGIKDCADGSDEWTQRKNRKWSLASKDKMVRDWYVLATMWIVGICATFGNSIVIFKTLATLLKLNGVRPWSKLRLLAPTFHILPRTKGNDFKQKDTSTKWRRGNVLRGWKKSIRIWDSTFILNLAVADFLMGTYLVVLGSVALSQTTNYWEFDKTWRTSLLCQSLGVLTVLSSQTSVFTLVGLTTLRLSTVIKPFGVFILKRMKLLALICGVIWTVSFFIAIFPILPKVKFAYASEAWVPLPHVRPNVVNLTVANDLLRKTVTFSNNVTATMLVNGENLSWDELTTIFSTLAPAYSDWKFFGYYSAHSFCLPKLFVSIGETAWEHTVVLLSINLFAFIYICIAYIIIYRLSIRSRSVVRNASEKSITRDCSYMSVKDLPGLRNGSPLYHDEGNETLSQRRIQPGRNDSNNNTKRKGDYHMHCKRRVGNMHKMQFRIALLVATDFLCWVPICVMGFCHLSGFDISNTAYTVSAIGLLPVNSALNPILYSNCILNAPKSCCRRK